MQSFFMRSTKSDGTALMRRLISIVAGNTYPKVRFLTCTHMKTVEILTHTYNIHKLRTKLVVYNIIGDV